MLCINVNVLFKTYENKNLGNKMFTYVINTNNMLLILIIYKEFIFWIYKDIYLILKIWDLR